MKNFKKLLFITASVMLFALMGLSSYSCKSEEVEPVTEPPPPPPPPPPPTNCNTSNVTFSGTIVPILQANCYNNCHSGTNPLSGFLLTTYEGVKAKVDEGRLFGAVAREAGFVPMPQGQPKLNDCLIAQIKAWIDAGAMNN